MAVKQKQEIPWVYPLLIAIFPLVTLQRWLDDGDIWNLWLVKLVWLIGTSSRAATWHQRTSCWKLPRFAPCNMSGLFLFVQRLLQNIFPENKQNFALAIYIYTYVPVFKQFWAHFPLFPSFRPLISNLIFCNESISRFPHGICPAALLGHFKVACKILIFQARILAYSIALPQTSVHQLNCSFVWACQFLHFHTPTSVWAFC